MLSQVENPPMAKELTTGLIGWTLLGAVFMAFAFADAGRVADKDCAPPLNLVYKMDAC